MKRFCLVKGIAGVGNRLMTLTAAVQYAEKTGRQVLVDWNDGYYAPKGTNAFPLFFQSDTVQPVEKAEGLSDLTWYPSSAGHNTDPWHLSNYFEVAHPTNFSVTQVEFAYHAIIRRVSDG